MALTIIFSIHLCSSVCWAASCSPCCFHRHCYADWSGCSCVSSRLEACWKFLLRPVQRPSFRHHHCHFLLSRVPPLAFRVLSASTSSGTFARCSTPHRDHHRLPSLPSRYRCWQLHYRYPQNRKHPSYPWWRLSRLYLRHRRSCRQNRMICRRRRHHCHSRNSWPSLPCSTTSFLFLHSSFSWQV